MNGKTAHKNRPLIYLASPYSSLSLKGEAKERFEERRFEEVCQAAAHFMAEGHHIFCPISHTHPLVKYGLQDKKGPWWLEQDFAILQHCGELWVYMMRGWEKSYGVTEEIKFAEEHGIPVTYVEPLTTTEKLVG